MTTDDKSVSDKLAPCPFCGVEASVVRVDVEPQGDPWYGKKLETLVRCTRCGACLFDTYFHEGFADNISAIAAWNSRSPPSGYRLVPEEPTREMILAAEAELESQTDSDYDSDADGNRYPYSIRRPGWEAHVYAAMLAKAPSPKEGK